MGIINHVYRTRGLLQSHMRNYLTVHVSQVKPVRLPGRSGGWNRTELNTPMKSTIGICLGGVAKQIELKWLKKQETAVTQCSAVI